MTIPVIDEDMTINVLKIYCSNIVLYDDRVLPKRKAGIFSAERRSNNFGHKLLMIGEGRRWEDQVMNDRRNEIKKYVR